MKTEDQIIPAEQIYFDGDYFSSFLIDISLAKKSILFETYIFNNDAAGKMLSDALINASKRGVHVRVLVDGVGSSDWDDELAIKLQTHGVEIRVYHPLPWNLHHWKYADHVSKLIIDKLNFFLSNINLRDHRKLCIIDDDIVYIGSANITEHLINKDKKEYWRETTVRLSGVEAEMLQIAFDKAWNGKRKKYHKMKPLESTSFILNYSRRMRRSNFKALLSKITASKDVIWITNAYFVPNYRILKALKKADKRGVEVVILLPHLSDVVISTLAARTFYADLLKSGVDIYEYMNRFLHAKSLIIDDWYLIGSSNFNARSLLHDLEVDVVIQAENAKIKLKQQFLIDLASSHKINSKDIVKQGWFKYLLGHIILFFRNWI